MTRLRSLAGALTAVLVLALTPAAATAAPTPLADCAAHHGNLTHVYSVAALQHALTRIPPSFAEYTACYAAIQNALNTQVGGQNLGNQPGAGGTSGGSGATALIVIVVVVLLGGGGAAAWAYRRRRTEGGAP